MNGIVTPSAISLFPVHSALLIFWSLIWKGFALWRAAQNGDRPWFIVLLFINTLGVLDILYLFVFSKMGAQKASKAVQEQQQQRQQQ